MKDRKGFTLPELLVVVAIIGILVAISIPIFSNQIERSRDAVSIANIRSAYAEAQVFYMSPDDATRPQYSKGFTFIMMMAHAKSLDSIRGITRPFRRPSQSTT